MKGISCLGSILLSVDQKKSLIQFISIKFVLLIVIVMWIQFMDKKYISNYDVVQEAIQNEIVVKAEKNVEKAIVKADTLSKHLKYILLWSSVKFAPFYYFREGQRGFIENNCSHINCYVTRNKQFFNGDTTKFDVIAFNGRTLKNDSQLPKNRSSHQLFMYFNMESADNCPVCSEKYDDFFNWTGTYRLDSDIPLPYIQIRNSRGKVIGPKINMRWSDLGIPHDDELATGMQNKTKAVAWFVSNCYSRSRRGLYVFQLQKALYPFGLSVDIYGHCGFLNCSRLKNNVCFSLLKKEYYFYLAFENSFAEDYITEKVLTALQHNSVPIVFGGADYSRFLPPGSYINARRMTPKDLASKIAGIMKNTKYYIRYFRWRSYYSYEDPSSTDNVCAVCKALNDENKIKNSSTYKNFRKWWILRYKYRCK